MSKLGCGFVLARLIRHISLHRGCALVREMMNPVSYVCRKSLLCVCVHMACLRGCQNCSSIARCSVIKKRTVLLLELILESKETVKFQ